MKLRLVVNWIREFLKQLHANMPEQLFAVVNDPAAPWARAGAKHLRTNRDLVSVADPASARN